MAIHTSIEININLDKAIEDLSTNKVLKVGWVDKSKYENGQYVAEIAAQNEYGAPHKHIDARPFMAPAVANNKNKWLAIASQGSKKAALGETTILDVLDLVGAKASGDIKKAIKDVISPPLSLYTIAARLSKYGNKKRVGALTKPLVDTGIMLATVTYSVEEES